MHIDLREIEQKYDGAVGVTVLSPADLPAEMADRTAPGGRRTRQVSDRSSAGEAVLAYLDIQAARLAALGPAVRRDEADAIHQMRVAARRLRAAVAAFPAVLPRQSTQHLRDELKWLGQVLGGARDLEVLKEGFRSGLDALPADLVLGPARARLTTHFAPREAAARQAAIGALDSPRYVALLDELHSMLTAPPRGKAATAPAAQTLPHAVGQAYRRTRRGMRQAGQLPPGQERDLMLHEARKAAKRARYAAEVARPVAGKPAARLAARLKAVQSVLGDHHDAITAQQASREIGVNAHLAGENAFTFGVLHERASRQAVTAEDQASRAWKRAASRKTRRWLR
ncbi:MAG TPA: CHAD domain-containing protein [Trebonia sp.]|nr:CHAD domain-containing protein [Trebonia sp.]